MMDELPFLRFSNVAFSYKDDPDKLVLIDASFEVRAGEILGLVGPNGTGKTTIMNLISGHLTPSSGEIDRKAGWKGPFSIAIPQEYSLLDWKSVEENIKLGLINSGIDRSQINKKVQDVLETLGIADIRDIHPPRLSGGTKQRVAIARALAADPSLILLDEPFNGLDFKTKSILIKDFKRLIKSTRKAAIIISHDPHEIRDLADRVIVLSNGKCYGRS